MPKATITRVGNLIRIVPDYHLVLSDELTYSKRERDLNPRSRRKFKYTKTVLYQFDRNQLYVPAGLTTRVAKRLRKEGIEVEFEDLRPLILGDPDFSQLDKLREHQTDMLARVLTHDCGQLEGPTAVGKSFLIRQLCRIWPDPHILVVCPYKQVVDRMYRDMLTYLGPEQLGKVGGGSKDFNKRVVVSTAASLGYCRLKDCRLLLFDEVHRAASPKTAARLAEVTHARMFGFSATTGSRSDNTNMETEALFGPVIYKVPYSRVQAAGDIVPLKIYIVRCRGLEKVYNEQDVALYRNGLWRHAGRIELIRRAVHWLWDKYGEEKQTLVSAATTDQLFHTAVKFPDWEVCYGSMSTTDRDFFAGRGLLDPDKHPQTTKERKRIEEAYEKGEIRRALATTTSGGVWSTGCDFPQLSLLVRSDGQGGALNTQIPGRLARKFPGKELGVMIDFDDVHNERLGRRAQKRIDVYQRKKWDVEYLCLD